MTNLRDPYSPQATAGYRSGTAVGAVNWSGAAGFVSSTSATSVATGTTYNTGYFFAPAVTQTAVGSGTYYGLQFSGSVSVAATTLPAGTATPTRWYSGLTINVNTGTDGSAINAAATADHPPDRGSSVR